MLKKFPSIDKRVPNHLLVQAATRCRRWVWSTQLLRVGHSQAPSQFWQCQSWSVCQDARSPGPHGPPRPARSPVRTLLSTRSFVCWLLRRTHRVALIGRACALHHPCHVCTCSPYEGTMFPSMQARVTHAPDCPVHDVFAEIATQGAVGDKRRSSKVCPAMWSPNQWSSEASGSPNHWSSEASGSRGIHDPPVTPKKKGVERELYQLQAWVS